MKRFLLLRSASLATLALATTAAHAAVFTQVASRAALAGSDTLDFSSTDGLGFVPAPIFSTSSGGIGVRIDDLGVFGHYHTYRQGSDTTRDFSPGDYLLYSHGGTTTFTLDTPVYGAGLNISTPFSDGPFYAKIEAYNGSTSLGSFIANGTASSANDGSALFLGFRSAAADVTSFSVTMSDGNWFNDFVFNQVSFATLPTAVPEPSEYAAVVGLALGVFALVHHRRQAAAR